MLVVVPHLTGAAREPQVTMTSKEKIEAYNAARAPAATQITRTTKANISG